MAASIIRPGSIFDAASGLLRVEQFQIAYATNDIERACDVFAERYGIHAFRRMGGALPAGGNISIALAWVGPTMYELLTASGAGSDIYMSRLPAGDDFAIRHHHLGYLVPDQAQWDVLMAEVTRGGFAMPYRNTTPGLMTSCFIDAPELGHYLEYLFPTPTGLAFLQDVPRN